MLLFIANIYVLFIIYEIYNFFFVYENYLVCQYLFGTLFLF